MRTRRKISFILLLAVLSIYLFPVGQARAQPAPADSLLANEVTAFDLIIAMNTLRASYGLPMLVEDPIINAVSQSTAAIMAANQMSWHIGDVPGRLTAAGYGGGVKVFATENFAMGNMSIDEIMVVWSDASHMIPAVNPAYCNVGAGVAKSPNGMTYYVLQAAYTTNKSCGEYKSPDGNINPPGGTTGGSQIVVPVKIAAPDADGKIFHIVEAGQSFWSIAVAYKITIKDIETWNNLSKNSKLQIGQRLFIPSSNTAGYATPTPVGMVQISLPDPTGKVVHVVQPYQTLSSISQAYHTPVDQILTLNGIQLDWPLQIGQKLLIKPSQVTPSATPLPLSPAERLTPAADGKYYHEVKNGETLSAIANIYQITVNELITWNGLNGDMIRAGQKLLLQITPPPTKTATPQPPTATIRPTQTAQSSIATSTATMLIQSSSTTIPTASQPASRANLSLAPFVAIGVIGLAILAISIYFRRRSQ